MPMQNWRIWLLFYLMIGMMAALFLSRSALSACMIGFFIASFLHKEWRLQFKKFIQTPLLWGMGILFFLPLISGLWSDDKEHWVGIIQVKLPLLFFPLAFAAPFEFNARQWK